MSQGPDGSASSAYRPTSLDFINLPNPIEPAAASQKHPLNATPHLGKASLEATSKHDLLKYLHEPSNDRAGARKKPGEATSLDLPKLPPPSAVKRPRLPPTLSGLHQPPPDAGLLPSISTEQPELPPPRPSAHAWSDASPLPATTCPEARIPENLRDREPDTTDPSVLPKREKAPPKRQQRNKWTDQETNDLLKGAARYGIGSWTKILHCEEFHFNKRTALDLKDRFRVCCPDQYRKTFSAGTKNSGPTGGIANKPAAKGPPTERVSSTKLKELGIDRPFAKTGRRQRHGYTIAEDEALLRGFRKYKNSWSAIKHDTRLGLSNRKATDLRDRFRTRYPKEYAEAGLSLRHDKPAKDASQVAAPNIEQPPSVEDAADAELNDMNFEVSFSGSITRAGETSSKSEASGPKLKSQKQPQPAPFSLDDVFLGMPFETNETENEPIVLDRGILDWAATDAMNHTSSDVSKPHGIDPQMTLKLPKPAPSVVPCQQLGVPLHGLQGSNATSLPSLAAMLQDSRSNEQLELPSFSTWVQLTETDGKIDELLDYDPRAER